MKIHKGIGKEFSYNHQQKQNQKFLQKREHVPGRGVHRLERKVFDGSWPEYKAGKENSRRRRRSSTCSDPPRPS